MRYHPVLSIYENLPVGRLGFGLEGLVVAVAVESESVAALTARSAFVTFDSAGPDNNQIFVGKRG